MRYLWHFGPLRRHGRLWHFGLPRRHGLLRRHGCLWRIGLLRFSVQMNPFRHFPKPHFYNSKRWALPVFRCRYRSKNTTTHGKRCHCTFTASPPQPLHKLYNESALIANPFTKFDNFGKWAGPYELLISVRQLYRPFPIRSIS